MRTNKNVSIQNRINLIQDLQKHLSRSRYVNLDEKCRLHNVSKTCSTMLIEKGVVVRIGRAQYKFNKDAYFNDVELASSLFHQTNQKNIKEKSNLKLNKKPKKTDLFKVKNNKSLSIKIFGITIFEKLIK